MAAFGLIAPHYDELMSKVPYDTWAGYYRLLLAQIGHEPETLLDVCCGTGTCAEILTREGYKVTGFDISPPMIAEAIRKAHEKNLQIDYHVADAATLELDTKFDSAYSFFDSLNYIADPEHLRKSIIKVGEHLNPGGSFIFDVNTAYSFEANLFDQEDMRKDTKLKYHWRGDYDSEKKIITVTMNFWYGDQVFQEVHVQRAYSDEEIRDYLSDADLEVVKLFDSYTLDHPREKSDRLHYVTVLRTG